MSSADEPWHGSFGPLVTICSETNVLHRRALEFLMYHVKYPRTRHVPWSPGSTSDDLLSDSLLPLHGKRVIVTEKMDGENSSLYRDGYHARSLDSRHHPSRNWVKAMHASIAHLIPEGWRVCGENLYALHSIAYNELPSYFLMFSIWNEHNQCLSWDETVEWANLLGLTHVPVLYDGMYDEARLRAMKPDTDVSEGYVVRLAESFSFSDFGAVVAKWVRTNHVQSEEHWMHKAVVPNGLGPKYGEGQ